MAKRRLSLNLNDSRAALAALDTDGGESDLALDLAEAWREKTRREAALWRRCQVLLRRARAVGGGAPTGGAGERHRLWLKQMDVLAPERRALARRLRQTRARSIAGVAAKLDICLMQARSDDMHELDLKLLRSARDDLEALGAP